MSAVATQMVAHMPSEYVQTVKRRLADRQSVSEVKI